MNSKMNSKMDVSIIITIICTRSLTYPQFFRNVALMGGLVLLLAEDMGEAKTMFAGVPTMGRLLLFS